MRPEFTRPDFVESSDPETIQERMMKRLPADISDMPGDFPYDFTMPTAIEISQLIQFHVIRALMIAYPEYAWGDWLDLHGAQVHVARHKANYATGHVTVYGDAGTVIGAGAVFCVPATDVKEAIEYVADERAEIVEGSVRVAVTAMQAGPGSNTAAGTVTIMLKPVKGVLSITNEAGITGGTDAESDELYYERIHAEYSDENSYVGNDGDYIRWAKEVAGIGDCIVDPAWDGPGTVKLILVDGNGSPANDQLLEAVYEHIMSPSDRSKRLMPTGSARLTVAAAKTKEASYSCTGMTLAGISVEEAAAAFREVVVTLYADAKKAGTLRYNDVRPVLSRIVGIEDFEDFKMNGGYENIAIAKDEYVATGQVVFTEKEE